MLRSVDGIIVFFSKALSNIENIFNVTDNNLDFLTL
jgi:hypothetical protein